MSRTLHWPRRIARTDRTPLAAGHGSFCLDRTHLGTDAFDRQRIRLSGYLLVLVREGSVIVDRGQHSVLLREGDAALMTPGEFQLTEIPRPKLSRGATRFYFFNQRALADWAAKREGLDEAAARIALPSLPFYAVQRLGLVLAATAVAGLSRPMNELGAVITAMLAARPAMALTFLKHQIFVPRLRLCLFLEGYAATNLDRHAIASHYPQGVRAFHRECALYVGLPVSRWMFRRRLEIAHAWLRCADCLVGDVASRLGFDDLRAFKGHLKRYGRFSVLELEVLRRFSPRRTLAPLSTPFWFPSVEAQNAKMTINHLDFLDIQMTTPKERDMRAMLRKYPDERYQPVAARDHRFLTNNPPAETAVDTMVEQQPAVVGKIVNFDSIERWQLGNGVLYHEIEIERIAA